MVVSKTIRMGLLSCIHYIHTLRKRVLMYIIKQLEYGCTRYVKQVMGLYNVYKTRNALFIQQGIGLYNVYKTKYGDVSCI